MGFLLLKGVFHEEQTARGGHGGCRKTQMKPDGDKDQRASDGDGRSDHILDGCRTVISKQLSAQLNKNSSFFSYFTKSFFF